MSAVAGRHVPSVVLAAPLVQVLVVMGSMRGMAGVGTRWMEIISARPLWLWAVIGLVGLAIVAGLGYLLYRVNRSDAEEPDPALEELRTAYARGDLSYEEFEDRLEQLEQEP